MHIYNFIYSNKIFIKKPNFCPKKTIFIVSNKIFNLPRIRLFYDDFTENIFISTLTVLIIFIYKSKTYNFKNRFCPKKKMRKKKVKNSQRKSF